MTGGWDTGRLPGSWLKRAFGWTGARCGGLLRRTGPGDNNKNDRQDVFDTVLQLGIFRDVGRTMDNTEIGGDLAKKRFCVGGW